MAGRRRDAFTQSELLRAVHMAGAGHSAAEIAAAIGHGFTAEFVYSLLRRQGVKLAPKSRAQVCVLVAVSRTLFQSVEVRALRRGADPAEAAGRILDAIAEDVRLLDRLLDVALVDDRSEARATAA